MSKPALPDEAVKPPLPAEEVEPPRPLEVVKEKPGFVGRLLEEIPKALVTAILLAYSAPYIAAYVSLFRPTCADPRNLMEVPHAQIKAEAPSANRKHHPARVVLDGRVANVWVPPLLSPADRPKWMSHKNDFGVVDRSQSSLRLELARPTDVQLVCVVNGLANNYSNYLNWGRVRSVQAWTDSDASKHLSVLGSMDQGSFQAFQDVSVPQGPADEIVVQVMDLYEGQQMTSVDPDVCDTRPEVGPGRQNDPVGCNLNATPLAGLAEVKVYRLKEPKWKAIWNLWRNANWR